MTIILYNSVYLIMWKILSKTNVFDHPYVKVQQWQLQLPSGKVGEYMVKDIPDAVIVCPITKDKHILLLRQFFVSSMSYEYTCVAGFIDKNLSALESAKAELVEEAGAQAKIWRELGSVKRDKWATGEIYFFLAYDVEIFSEQHLEDAEDIEVVSMTLQKWTVESGL